MADRTIVRLLTRPNNPMKVEQVAEITGLSADGIRKIARRYNLTGPDGLKDGHSRHPGGKSKVLTEEQLKQLYERLQTPPDDGGLWSGLKVGELIKQYFGIKVPRTTGWDYLKRLGFTLQVPRPLHAKSATPEAQVIFKQELKEFVRLIRWLCPHKQVEIWTQDEGRLGLKPVICRTWAPKGKRPVAHHHLATNGFILMDLLILEQERVVY